MPPVAPFRADHIFMRSGAPLTILDDIALNYSRLALRGHHPAPGGAANSRPAADHAQRIARSQARRCPRQQPADIYAGHDRDPPSASSRSRRYRPCRTHRRPGPTLARGCARRQHSRSGRSTSSLLQTMDQLGLRPHLPQARSAISPVANAAASSVGVELLAKPAILFLDEPSSGLDPATEFHLMELLRELADTGCTIVCTTHVMENAYLMDQLIVLVGGCLAFQGSAQGAREYFGVQKLTGLYDRLADRQPKEWQTANLERPAAVEETPAPTSASAHRPACPARVRHAHPCSRGNGPSCAPTGATSCCSEPSPSSSPPSSRG